MEDIQHYLRYPVYVPLHIGIGTSYSYALKQHTSAPGLTTIITVFMSIHVYPSKPIPRHGRFPYRAIPRTSSSICCSCVSLSSPCEYLSRLFHSVSLAFSSISPSTPRDERDGHFDTFGTEVHDLRNLELVQKARLRDQRSATICNQLVVEPSGLLLSLTSACYQSHPSPRFESRRRTRKWTCTPCIYLFR